MHRDYGQYHYATELIENRLEGYVGLELRRHQDNHKECVAKIVFWDSCGQFFLNTSGAEIPLDILEELITEAKTKIKVR